MRNNFKLELKKAQDDDKIFYRYRYESCVIWFEQDKRNGNIYRVNVADEQYSDVNYYVDDVEDKCYPSKIRLDFPRLFIESESDSDQANKKLQDCCIRRYAIEYFLLSGDHYKLWWKNHIEESLNEVFHNI